MQHYLQQRQVLMAQARAAEQYPVPGQLAQIAEQIYSLDARLPYIFLEQEIKNFPIFGRIGCLVTAMRNVSGQSLNVGNVSDDSYDLYLDEQIIKRGLSTSELIGIAKSLL